jgi:xanthine dehydrogenase accessory factor
MDPIVASACDLLDQDRAFVLATIIRQQGSAPRTAGTRMLITPEQQIVGTIGGGLLEAETMRTAARMSAEAPARMLTFDLTNQDAAAMEMICGGLVQVLLDYIQPCDANRALFFRWKDLLSNNQPAMLISTVYGDETHVQRIERAVLGSDGSVHGRLDFSADGREKLSLLMGQPVQIHVLHLEERLVVADPGQMAPTLYIFGGGHVARPTAHLAAMTGFNVVVLDDRPEFSAAERFPEAMGTRTIASFDAAFEGLPVSGNTYVIIVTRGHLHDRTVLAQALNTPAVYIGMIGSRRKRDTIYKRLLEDGYTSADIDRVHSPIGLTIGADTPEEIAVSIVAEMIAVRAGVRSYGNRV